MLTRVLSRENRINDEHDAKPPFTRDLDLLASHLALHDRGTILGHILSEHWDEVDPKKVATVRFGDRFALEWHAHLESNAIRVPELARP